MIPKKIHNQTEQNVTHWATIWAGVFCVPFMSILFAHLVVALFYPQDSDNVGYAGLIVLYAYYILPTWVGITTLLISTFAVLVAWAKSSMVSANIICLSVYSVTLLVHIGYVFWWFLTGQVWDYP